MRVFSTVAKSTSHLPHNALHSSSIYDGPFSEALVGKYIQVRGTIWWERLGRLGLYFYHLPQVTELASFPDHSQPDISNSQPIGICSSSPG